MPFVKTNNNWQNHWNVVPLSAGQSPIENYLYDYETLIRSDYLREAKPKAQKTIQNHLVIHEFLD